ncbi:telomerase reverse transcriptase [Nakaseomyces bracarensis]|uniref:telomerase reverse transcriptase n=1 Tax=Nakaseomyces bracarensis TaxID=273131 RepID=UPI00387102A9
MKLLAEYIYGEDAAFLDSSDDITNQLNSYFVVKNERVISFPNESIDLSLSHKNLIDQCIVILLQKKLHKNVLVTGYKLARNDSIRNVLHSDISNTCVTILKSKQWEKMHLIMGTYKFLELIFNYSVFWFNGLNFVQIIGSIFNLPNDPPKWIQNKVEIPVFDLPNMYVHNKGFLYYDASNFRTESILLGRNYRRASNREKIEALKSLIFDNSSKFLNENELLNLSNDSSINKILISVVVKEKKVKYLSILESICPKSILKTPHIANTTPLKQVSRFLIIVLEKLRICGLLVSKKNKALVFKNILPFLKLPINGKLLLFDIINGLNYDELRLGKKSKKCIIFFMVSIISYIFGKLIPSILRCFFYCTEVSSFTEILFFRRDIWNQLTKGFLDSYFSKFLLQNKECIEHYSYLRSKYNHCKLRLLPKKADNEYRVIGIPMKGENNEEHLLYKQNFFKVIMPSRIVLDFLRRNRVTLFEKLYSTSQICTQIRDYKKQIIKLFGHIPTLHILKFDIANCYDSIPIKKVRSILKKLLNNAETNKFIIKNISILDLRTGDGRAASIINGNTNKKDHVVISDNLSTTSLMKNEILDIVDNEITNTAIMFRGNCFKRRDGLFQGQNLSATIVDILYDDMLENYSEIKSFANKHSLVLRHADDFLFISTNINIVENLKTKVLNGFHEYGSYVKPQKVILESTIDRKTKLTFCGLEIKLNTLEVIKPYTSMNQTKITGVISSMFLEKLLNLYKLRINNGTLDFYLNSPPVILEQIHHATKNIILILIDSNLKEVKEEDFYIFLERLVDETITQFKNADELNDFILLNIKSCVKVTILKTTREVLSRKHSSYTHIIKVLEKVS